jgi:hypothetical protein
MALDETDEGASDSDADEGAIVPHSCLPAPALLDSDTALI